MKLALTRPSSLMNFGTAYTWDFYTTEIWLQIQFIVECDGYNGDSVQQYSVWACLRLPYTFRSTFFFNLDFWAEILVAVWSLIFFKMLLKNTKYWRSYRSFTFLPEVKVYLLIDSPMTSCNRPKRLFFSFQQLYLQDDHLHYLQN